MYYTVLYVKILARHTLYLKPRSATGWSSGVSLVGLASKRQMKIMLQWMRERQKLRLVCDHD